MTPSEYIRKRTLGRKLVIKKYRALPPRVVQEINAIGVNLNQLVRNTHFSGEVPEEIHGVLKKIQDIVLKAVEDIDCKD